MSAGTSPSRDDLLLVAKHGSGDLERALATVQLAEREGRLEELEEIVEAAG